MPVNEFYMPCVIERGGFSSERCFEVELQDGDKLVGLAFVEYVLDENMKPLDKNSPAFGKPIRGFVQCRLLQQIDEKTVLIEVPSSDVIRVPAEKLAAAG
jgi:hypothetical protein